MRWLALLAPLAGCPSTAPGTLPSTGDTGAPTVPTTPGVPFVAIGFNTESGGSDPARVTTDTIAPITGEGLWGFAEVEDEAAAELYVAAAHDPGSDQQWDHVIGSTGWSDRLVLAWDDDRFALESWEELDHVNVGGTARAPLVGTVRERETDTTFLFVVNHLWRTDAAARHEQAELLRLWGAEQELPIVMVGDYNFDWDVTTGAHDEGYDALTADGVFRWVRPEPLITTQCSAFYDSVLDFAFVGGPARDWPASSEILWRDEDYCGSRTTEVWSDHRPVSITVTLPR